MRYPERGPEAADRGDDELAVPSKIAPSAALVIAGSLSLILAACLRAEEKSVLLSIRFIAGAPDGWHDDALASGTRTYGEEGCIVRVPEAEADEIVQLFHAQKPKTISDRRAEDRAGGHWGASAGFSGIVRFAYGNGSGFSIGDNSSIRDENGRYHSIPRREWVMLMEKSYGIARSKGCRGAEEWNAG